MAVCRAVRAFLTLLLFVQAGYACYPQNLLLCWDMQEGQLTRVKDSVKGVDGAMTGTVAWVPGQQPRGLNEFPTSASSNTFVNTGEWMVSFPGSNGNDVRTPTDAIDFDFPGNVPFQIGLTIAPSVLKPPSGSPEIVSNCAAGQGWQMHYQSGDRHLVFYILGVATYDFGYGDATDNGILVQDLNPHRIFFARNATRMYFFVDGKSVGDKTLIPGAINTGDNALTVGGNNGATGNYIGKASHLAVYNYPFNTFSEILAFAKNDYYYWHGLNSSSDDGDE